jgi:hypothetical protein
MPDRSSKRPTDPNQLAKLMVDIAAGEVSDSVLDGPAKKNPAAVALGRLGGKRGGKARADKLTPEQRKEIASKAAASRWKRDR